MSDESPTRSSAEVLTEIWEQFKQGARASDGVSPSKLKTSLMLFNDQYVLGRWTKPGKRPNWRIPVSRIADLCKALNAKPEQYHELMYARLLETGQGSNELAAAEWGTELVNINLDLDQKTVLNIYNRVRVNYPRGLYQDEGEPAYLEKFFTKLLNRAERLQTEEDAAEDAARTPEAEETVKARRLEQHQAKEERARALDSRKQEISAERRTMEFLKKVRGHIDNPVQFPQEKKPQG